MKMPSPEVTQLLLDWSRGDEQALERLMPVVYEDLRRLANHFLQQERGEHTLQPTALVHEAYLRLMDLNRVQWRDRAHFFAVAAELMRRILVDHARRHQAAKRGSGGQKISLDEALHGAVDEPIEGRAKYDVDIIALDNALRNLAVIDERKSRLVLLRFFGGLSLDEVAEALNISRATAIREWRMARAWLFRELGGGSRDDS
ncbi:MAG: sigma-70 family RNA polymerase sigma factor [Blastocatellia bacterium]